MKPTSSSIITPTSALRIIGYIRAFYREQGLGEIGHVQLHVLSQGEMEWRYGDGVVGNATSQHVINTLRHVPPSVFASIFAHELLHIWQYEHGLFYLEPELCEGFCNLGSYLFLQRVGTPGCRRCMSLLLHNPDPIYGGGFRLLLSLYQHKGWLTVMQLLFTSNARNDPTKTH